MSGKIIAIVNNKGGVGKTTLTINLAHALANKKRKVLVIDTDSQCNASKLLIKPEFINESLYEILEGYNVQPDLPIYPTIYTNLSCIPNVEDTAALEFRLAKKLPENYALLKRYLKEHVTENFDYTFIDCPPNMGFFVINALMAADFVIVPVLCGSSFSIEGLTRAIKLVNEIRKTGNENLRFLRLLINAVDKRTAMSKLIIGQLSKKFGGDEIFKTKIGTSTAFQQAEFLSKTVLRHAARSPGAKSYRELAIELADIFGDNITAD
jgi:cellulose biosynthesis protein BcsQ